MSAVKLALIGLGRRGRDVYLPVIDAVKGQVELVALCDCQPESANQVGREKGVKAFCSVRALAAAGLAEAAIICTPPESHHAISVFLSRAGLHHICETPMAVTRRQCREMVEEATKGSVVLHVNEQFFRREVIAFSRQLISAGVIGEVHRITTFHGHTGYHNNSIIQFFAGSTPVAVNAFGHAMPLRRHLDGAGRWQEAEQFRLRLMHFANGMLVTDGGGNIKSAMGRCPRPGYLEIDGTEGTIVEQPSGRPAPWEGKAEVRLVAGEDLERGAYAESYPIERVSVIGHRVHVSNRLPWECDYHKLRVRLPGRTLEYENPMLGYGITHNYLSTVAQSTLNFVAALRGGEREFSVAMAVGSQEMEAACGRSAAMAGARVELPLPEEDTPEESAALEGLTRRFGVDPMDVEAMLDIAYPSNYVA